MSHACHVHVPCMCRACAVHVKWNKGAVSIAMIDKKHGIARVRGSHKQWNGTPRARRAHAVKCGMRCVQRGVRSSREVTRDTRTEQVALG